MKTFKEFISEAEGTATQIAQLRAKARMLRQKGDMAGALEVEKQAGELQAGTQAKIAALTSDKPKTPKTRQQRGYASKPADTRGSTGSLANIPSSAGEGDGTVVHGRFGATTSTSQGGGRVSLRNKGVSRSGGQIGGKST